MHCKRGENIDTMSFRLLCQFAYNDSPTRHFAYCRLAYVDSPTNLT